MLFWLAIYQDNNLYINFPLCFILYFCARNICPYTQKPKLNQRSQDVRSQQDQDAVRLDQEGQGHGHNLQGQIGQVGSEVEGRMEVNPAPAKPVVNSRVHVGQQARQQVGCIHWQTLMHLVTH